MNLLQALLRLMDCRGYKSRNGPEDLLAIEVANYLRAATLEGRLRATWTHIPNEIGGVSSSSVSLRMAQARYAKAKAMGMITGTPDYVFVWAGGGAWVELKAPSGSLSPRQKDYREWANATGSHHAVCKSLEEVVDYLFMLGVLRR